MSSQRSVRGEFHLEDCTVVTLHEAYLAVVALDDEVGKEQPESPVAIEPGLLRIHINKSPGG